MTAVIMAGGKGTRIRSVSEELPKPMILIDGKPVLWYVIQQLKKYGFTDIIITVGYKAESITEWASDGSELGVNISYFVEEEPLGNAGALLRIKDRLTDDFLLVNGDVIFDVDLKCFAEYHRSRGGLITLLTHPNSHPYDSGIIVADDNGKVSECFAKEDTKPPFYKNRTNAGLHILNVKALDGVDSQKERIDLDRDVIRPAIPSENVYCYDSTEYVRDMGTPERYSMVCDDYVKGRISAKNRNNLQKAIFLDRDGTINKEVGFLKSIDEFELIPGAAEAIKKINNSGYLAVVVTNQPVIARGEVTREGLRDIHYYMETLLGEQGAYLDDIYYCPHHPHKGFEGEVTELKIECDCRKPKPGMLLKAAEEHNIDLKHSWIIGDDHKDIEAGENAGCRTVFITNDPKTELFEADSLITAVDIILKECEEQNND